MDKLPIDIHLTRLVDWLLDRRNCPRDWQKYVTPIRNKINLAILDMPENAEITALLSGSTIHYFNCLKIVEILRETEKDTKNFLGMYSSQRMKDWNSVLSHYQKNNVYLAEAASLLQRNVAYEIPALRKQIKQCGHQQTELDEKHTSLGKSITEINIQIKQACVELGIEGNDISSELKALPNQVGQIFDEVVEKSRSLTKAVDFYTNYIDYFFQRSASEALPILLHLVQRGNTTVYEWRTGVEPTSVEKDLNATLKFGDEEEAAEDTNGEIDFGIDFGTDEAADVNLDQDGADIDWGDFDSAAVVDYDVDAVDYDIEALRNEISVEEAGVFVPTDNIAKGNDAFTLLEWAETRNLIMNDLFKLQTFLKQKYTEMSSESDNLLITSILQDAPKSIQSVTEKDLKCFNECIKDLLGYFKIKRVEQLLRVNDSPTYLKRLYDQFVVKQKAIKRCNTNKALCLEKQKEFAQEAIDLDVKLKEILQKTKELQACVCQDLSKKYNGVKINLMGEINVL